MFSIATAFLLSAGAAAVADAPPASVAGVAEARLDGRQLACEGVLLIPRSPAVDLEIARVFGSNDSAERIVRQREVVRRRSGRGGTLHSGWRRSDCRDGYYAYRFSFSDVPPGEYYLTAFLAPAAEGPLNDFTRRGIDLMRRLTVSAGSTLEVDLTRD